MGLDPKDFESFYYFAINCMTHFGCTGRIDTFTSEDYDWYSEAKDHIIDSNLWKKVIVVYEQD